jgi:transcriptional regulator with XRE-family HTH domain
MDELKVIGKNIARIRKERGLTQEDLAGEMELDRPYLSEVENGKMNVTIKTLVSFARTLDTSLDELVRNSSPKRKKSKRWL